MTQLEELQDLKHRLEDVEREVRELKAQHTRPQQRLGSPWARICGMLADEPLYDDWQKSMSEYRDEVDRAAQS